MACGNACGRESFREPRGALYLIRAPESRLDVCSTLANLFETVGSKFTNTNFEWKKKKNANLRINLSSGDIAVMHQFEIQGGKVRTPAEALDPPIAGWMDVGMPERRRAEELCGHM